MLEPVLIGWRQPFLSKATLSEVTLVTDISPNGSIYTREIGKCYKSSFPWIASCETHTRASSERLLLPPNSCLCCRLEPDLCFLNENLLFYRVKFKFLSMLPLSHLISQQPLTTLLASPMSDHVVSPSCCVTFS